jgi:hypothetical protein
MEFALYVGNHGHLEGTIQMYVANIQRLMKTNRYLKAMSKLGFTGFSRLYFGCEFCERLIPTPEELRHALDLCEEKNLELTLLTPYVTDHGLKRLGLLFEMLSHAKIGTEVVFNDWGVFNLVKRKYGFPMGMGRLLTKQKKEPCFAEDLIDRNFLNLDRNTRDIITKTPLDASENMKNFIHENRISRVEMDNVYQGIDIDIEIKKSIYYPFIPVSTSRFCMASAYSNRQAYVRGKWPCNRECLKTSYNCKINNVQLILKGNTQFYCNNRLPKNIGLFDRIVFEPPEQFI